MKGVYRRKLTYWYRFTWQGRRYRLSLGTRSEAEAITKALEIMGNPAPYVRGKTMVAVALDHYRSHMKRKGIGEAWGEEQEIRLNAFFRDHSIRHPTEISKKRVEAWLAGFENENTRDQNLGVISRFTRWLISEGQLIHDPCREIARKPTRRNPRYDFLTRDQCRKIIEACGDDLDIKIAVMLSLHAGLRRGECLAARRGWFDLGAGLLHIKSDETWSPKNGKDRTIPMTTELVEFLKSIELRDPFLIRPDKLDASRRIRWDWRKPWAKVREDAGVTCRFHDLRRTFGSLHASAGTSPYKVAKWLGHSILVFERHYGHLIPADDEINRAWD